MFQSKLKIIRLADSVFNKAQLEYNLKNYNTADSLFILAKDLDALRFRAPEEINSVIRRLAKEYNCGLVEVDSIFNSTSPNKIVGNNLIVDHLHPTLAGYQLLGKIYFEGMLMYGFLPDENELQIAINTQDSLVINSFAFSRLDSEIAKIRIKGLLNDWPFVAKTDFSFINRIYQKDKIDSIAFSVAVKNQNWERSHRQAANWYLSKKNYKNFSLEMNVLISQYSYKFPDYNFTAAKLVEAGQYDLAYPFLLKRYKLNPDEFSVKWLGNINLFRKNIEEAIKYLEESLRLNNSDPQTYFNLCGAWIQKKEYSKALGYINKCLELDESFPKAQQLMMQLTNILK